MIAYYYRVALISYTWITLYKDMHGYTQQETGGGGAPSYSIYDFRLPKWQEQQQQ